MKPHVLVTLADKNYIEQAKQLFSSAYWNGGWDGDYLLLAHEIPESDLKWFRSKGILVKKVNQLIPEIPKMTWSPIVFSKIHLFDKDFKKWKNVVFLDADIIVRASIKRLAKIKGIVGVRSYSRLSDLFVSRVYMKLTRINPSICGEIKKLYDLNHPSFNSGVIAFTTDLIEKETFQKLKNLAERYAIIFEGDEPLINLLFIKKWRRLAKIYNIHPNEMIGVYKIPPKKLNAVILHFVGRYYDKPWDKNNPFYEEWKKNLERAELINLKKPVEGRIISETEIKTILKDLVQRRKKYFYRAFIFRTLLLIDEYIGLGGLFIKRISPRAYYFLKKLKKEKITR